MQRQSASALITHQIKHPRREGLPRHPSLRTLTGQQQAVQPPQDRWSTGAVHLAGCVCAKVWHRDGNVEAPRAQPRGNTRHRNGRPFGREARPWLVTALCKFGQTLSTPSLCTAEKLSCSHMPPCQLTIV